jgi:hypothetical protein
MWRVHRLDHISAKKPAKLLDSKSLTLGFSRKQIWPVFLPDPQKCAGRHAQEVPLWESDSDNRGQIALTAGIVRNLT